MCPYMLCHSVATALLGALLIAAVSRLRDACTLVTTGNFVPLTFSKIRMGNRFSSSSLTTNVVISKRGSTSLLMVKTSSGASCRTFSIKLRRSATLDFAFDKISRLDKFAALAVSIACSLFDDVRAFLVHELVTALGAENLDLLVPQFLPVAIELAVALRAGYSKHFRHGSSLSRRNFSLDSTVIPTELAIASDSWNPGLRRTTRFPLSRQ